MPNIRIHAESTGPGWAAAIRVPFLAEPWRLRGRERDGETLRAQIRPLLEAMRCLRTIPGSREGQVEVISSSEHLAEALGKGLIWRWERTGQGWKPGMPDVLLKLWEDFPLLASGIEILWEPPSPDNPPALTLECRETARAEAEGTGQTAEPPAPTSPEHARGFSRGFRAGYDAARRDMANALNGLMPDAQEAGEGVDDGLPF